MCDTSRHTINYFDRREEQIRQEMPPIKASFGAKVLLIATAIVIGVGFINWLIRGFNILPFLVAVGSASTAIWIFRNKKDQQLQQLQQQVGNDAEAMTALAAAQQTGCLPNNDRRFMRYQRSLPNFRQPGNLLANTMMQRERTLQQQSHHSQYHQHNVSHPLISQDEMRDLIYGIFGNADVVRLMPNGVLERVRGDHNFGQVIDADWFSDEPTQEWNDIARRNHER